jgi:hypothetical protein
MNNFSGKSPSVVSDDHLRAIGAVVVNWNGVEVIMELMILGLYEIAPNRGLILTSNLSFQNKLTILRILANGGAIQDGTEKRNLIAMLERLEQGHTKRNTIAHGVWADGKVQGLARRMAIRVRGRRLSTIDEQIPLMDVEKIANEFLALRLELGALAVRLGLHPELAPEPQ